MKKGSWSVLAIAALSVMLLATACGGGTATTSNTTTTKPPTTTTNPPTTTTNPPTTTTKPPTTTQSGGTLPTTGIAITTHNEAQLNGYKGLCLMCHGAGTTNSFPTTPSWDGAKNGSTVNKGVYTVAAGSNADHTGRTTDTCFTCHSAPGQTVPPTTTTTTTPPTTTTTTPPTTTTTTPPTSPTSTIASGVYFITITTSGFQPPELTAKAGIQITFTNNMEGDINLTGESGFTGNFGGLVGKGASVVFTFSAPGKYVVGLIEEHEECTITVVA